MESQETAQMMELAQSIVVVVAPEEIPSFEIVSVVFLEDPGVFGRRRRRTRREPIGFGAQLAGVLVTPIVLRAVREAHQFLKDLFLQPSGIDGETAGTKREIPQELADDLRRRLLQITKPLPDDKAALIVDSIVGSVTDHG